MLGHDYTRRHNEVLKYIRLLIMNKYGFKRSKKLRSHSVREVVENERAEVRVDITIKTDILIKPNEPDIFIYDFFFFFFLFNKRVIVLYIHSCLCSIACC